MPILVPAGGAKLAVNGTDLSQWAVIPDSLAPLMASPGKRGKNIVVPGRHGTIRTPRKRFDEADLVLKLWVLGAGPNGSVPVGSNAAYQLYTNADAILEAFAAETVLLTRTMPDFTIRQAVAEVLDVMDFTRNMGDAPLLGQVRIALVIPGAFWFDQNPVSQTVSGTTGATATLSAFAAATAPMTDLQLTFYGPISNPQLSQGGRYVQWNGVISAGQQLVLNTATWLPTPGSGTNWSPSLANVQFGGAGPSWFELDPSGGTVTLTHTGGGSASAQISGRRAYLSA